VTDAGRSNPWLCFARGASANRNAFLPNFSAR
jgi:hypothetical protein